MRSFGFNGPFLERKHGRKSAAWLGVSPDRYRQGRQKVHVIAWRMFPAAFPTSRADEHLAGLKALALPVYRLRRVRHADKG